MNTHTERRASGKRRSHNEIRFASFPLAPSVRVTNVSCVEFSHSLFGVSYIDSVCFVEEEMLTEISQNGEIDPEKWKDARESLLRRLDLVFAIHFPLQSNLLITIVES